MDTFKVAKPFKTTLRKFAEGATVTPSEIDGPMSFDDLKTKGFIVVAPVETPVDPEPDKKVRLSR